MDDTFMLKFLRARKYHVENAFKLVSIISNKSYQFIYYYKMQVIYKLEYRFTYANCIYIYIIYVYIINLNYIN